MCTHVMFVMNIHEYVHVYIYITSEKITGDGIGCNMYAYVHV